jgi:hypothetical protein
MLGAIQVQPTKRIRKCPVSGQFLIPDEPEMLGATK